MVIGLSFGIMFVTLTFFIISETYKTVLYVYDDIHVRTVFFTH